jgi:hypothetical protein
MRIKIDATAWNSATAQAYLRGAHTSGTGEMTLDTCFFEAIQGAVSNINRIQPITAINGGTINIGAGCQILSTKSGEENNLITALTSYSGSQITIAAASANAPLSINGEYTRIAEANGGNIFRATPSLPIVAGAATGQRYNALGGGTIHTQGGGSEYFPGSIAGSVESATYSWYR